MSEEISHRGTITDIDGTTLTVALVDDGASCDGCKIAAVCGNSAHSEMIRVRAVAADGLAVGDSVEIKAHDRGTWMAITIGLIAPCALMVAVVLIALSAGAGEGIAATIGLATLVPYYGALYMLRDRIVKGLVWDVRKL